MNARPLDPAVREHLARVRAFVHPGQVVPSTRCPADGCGETAAPTWPADDARRCDPAFEPLCARHREVAQVEQLRRDLAVAQALRVALRAGPLLPWPLPPPVSAAVVAAQAAAQRMRKAAPARHVATQTAPPAAPKRKLTRRRVCSRCDRPGHNARTCGKAGAR